MFKIYIGSILLTCLLIGKALTLTTAFNTCSNIVINTVQINNLPIPASDFTTPCTTTATFATAQPDNTYQALATFQHLVLSQANIQISITTYISAKSSGSIDISVTGADSGMYIVILKVIYLIVPSQYSSEVLAFAVDCCLTTSCLYTLNQPLNNAVNLTKAFPSSLKAGTKDAVAFFSSISLKATGTNFGQSVDVAILNNTHYKIILTNTAATAMNIGYFLVSIVAYNIPNPSLGIVITNDYVAVVRPTITLTNAANTFYGIYSYMVYNGIFNFTMSVVGNTITNVFGSKMSRCRQNTVTFAFGKCCFPTPYIDTNQSVCVDACPIRMFLQEGTVNCVVCQSDCYTCNNSLTCTSCNSTVDQRQLNTTTGRCDYIVSCPVRNYLQTSIMGCLPCAYDCYTCSLNTTCQTCNSTSDYRGFNFSTGRCDPILNYYESGVTVAAACTYPHCCGTSPIVYNAMSVCVAACPVRTYLEVSLNDCLPCAYDCYTCSLNTTCLSCNSTTDFRQFNSGTGRCDPILNYYESGVTVAAACTYPHCCGTSPIVYNAMSVCVAACPVRTYLEVSLNDCLPCAYDCYTCSLNTTCLSCNSTTDFRQFNSGTGRCDPILNYYESGVTVAAACTYPHCCGTSPIVYNAMSVCVAACPVRTYLEVSLNDCLPCAYDCYTCSLNTTCLSCNSTTDFRQFNSGTGRCDPILNYYESGVTVAAACTYPHCCGTSPIVYNAMSVCVAACPVRTYLEVSLNDCLPCAYDCYTCSLNTTCLSCNSTTDFRQFNSGTGRCDPILNYYESGVTVAAACTYPHCCGTSPIVYNAMSVCVAACPVRTYLEVSLNDCLPCAYDCYTCSLNTTCLSCNSTTDFRQFNSGTGRCDPILNYYESGVTVAAACTYPHCCGTSPIVYNAMSVCVAACPVRTYLEVSLNDCLPCAYDCYTCSLNTTCLSCNSTTDFRQFNSGTGRCDPILNYYESGVTVAAACTYPHCCGTSPIVYNAMSVCVAACPVRTYLEVSLNDCLPCAYDCYTCSLNTTCLSCNSTTDFRQFNSGTGRCDPILNYYESGVTVAAACTYPHCCGTSPIVYNAMSVCVAACPVRTYLEVSLNDCLPCAYDCYTCSLNTTCLSCNSTTDFRQFNSGTGRCDPILNYYESNVTIALLCTFPICCGTTPISYTATSTCVATCPVRTYLEISVNDCLPCAYDCFTCTSNSSCSTCDNITDKRQFNSSTGRCQPIFNFYDTGATIATPCAYPHCCGSAPIIYTTPSVCVSVCPQRTFRENVTLSCLPCAYDCYTCNQNLTCLSCNTSTDNRQFNPSTNRCDPIPGFYDPGTTVAILCTFAYPNCCLTMPYINTAQTSCTSSCPFRTYLLNNTMICLPCAYDCYTCSNNFTCDTCNPTDNRQFNSSTGRCDPIYNYYDSGVSGAVFCAFPTCCGSVPTLDMSLSACVGLCSIRNYLQQNTTNCLPCQYDCYTCINGFTCTSCNSSTDNRLYNPTTIRCDPLPDYFDPGTTIAAPCLYPNCCGTKPVFFYQNSTCLKECPKNYIQNTQNKTCSSCSPGYWPVTNQCTNIYGCLATKVINSAVICLVCNMTVKYALTNNTCICSQGYIFSDDTKSCKEVCGDGNHFDEKCDDGNLINGDGCSSTCTLETHFRCISSSPFEPSKCVYLGNKIQLSLNWINKTQGKNQGIFSFKVTTPYIKLNLTKSLVHYNFTSLPTPTSIDASITQNQIFIYADYDQDLEGNMAGLYLQLNPDYVEKVQNLSANFSMSSVGSKLVVIKNYRTLVTINQVIKILAYAVIATLVAASLSYRMIGVQLLHSFLVVYFVCLETTNPTELYMLFKSFQPINLNFMQNSNNFYSSSTAFTYSMEEELITKEQLTVSMILPFAAYGILKVFIYFKYMINMDQNKIQQVKLPRWITRLQSWLYNILFFPLAIGYLHYSLFPAFLAQTSPSNTQFFNKNTYIIIIIKLFLTFFCSFIFFYESKNSFTTKNHNTSATIKEEVRYENVYVMFWLGVMIVLSTNCLIKTNLLEEYLLLIYVSFGPFWFLRQRPYRRVLHNIGQITNLIMILVFLGWSTARKYMQKLRNEDNEILMMFAVLLLMSVTLMLTLARTVLQFTDNIECNKKSEKTKEPKKGKKGKKGLQINIDYVENMLEVENKYRLQNMLINKRLIDINCLEILEDHDQAKKQILNELKGKHSRTVNMSQ